jgi:hypothetical protein
MAMGLGEFLPSNWLIDWFASVACDVGGVPGVCESILFLLCGYDEAQVSIQYRLLRKSWRVSRIKKF